MPVVVIVFLLVISIGGGHGGGSPTGPLPPLTASAPPQATAQAASCTRVIEALPVRLGKLSPRVVDTRPSTPFVVAWGDPAIVLRCGVDKPASLKPGDDKKLIAGGSDAGAYYDVSTAGDANVYTSVDRQAYVSFTIPKDYQGADYLPTLNAAVLKAMPKPVCATDPNTPDPDQLCSRRTT